MDVTNRKQNFNSSSLLEHLSILVISTSQFNGFIYRALKEHSEKYYSGLVHVKLAESYENILGFDVTPMFDFIVVAVNTNIPHEVDTFSNHLKLIPSQYLVSRTVLVNGASDSGPHSAAVKIRQVAAEFDIPFFNAEVLDLDKTELLVDKIFRVLAFATGLKNGIPMTMITPSLLK